MWGRGGPVVLSFLPSPSPGDHSMRSFFLPLALGALALTAGSAPVDYPLGVPSASEFAEPVPIRVDDVQVGLTGGTSLGPEDRPMVVLHVDPEHRERVCTDTEFVLRRERLGTGELFVEMIPGQGRPVLPGHFFVARRADLVGQARDWWDEMIDLTEDGAVQDRLVALRERVDAAIAAGRDRWAEERPRLEREVEELLAEVEQDSERAAEDLRRWFDDMVERAEQAAARDRVAQ